MDLQVFGDWLVFRVFQRKRKAKKHGVVNSNKSHTSSTAVSCIDFTMEDCSGFGPQPTSPSSSGLTDRGLPQ